MHFYQTKSIHPTRPWRFYVALLGHLPVVLTLWSTCCMLTGCNTPSALTPYQLTPSAPATPAYMVNLHDLQLGYKEETFEQFFIERQAEAIWHRLRFCLPPAGIFGGINAYILDNDTVMNTMLFKHRPHVEADLRKAITLYIGHQKQLYLLSIQGITQEIAFGNLLLDHGLDEVWDRLQSAKNDSKDAVDLSGMLQGLPEAVQKEVLEGVVHFICNYCPQLFDLNLSCNGLTRLPESIGDLCNLCKLNLSRNNLTVLPESITQLMELCTLNLNDNHLTTLPDNFGNLNQLQILYLEYNQLTVLPDSMGDLNNLFMLDLFYNELTLLPDSIVNLTNLIMLNLSENQLTGLPESIGDLRNLYKLNLTNNKLTVLPDSIVKLSNLRSLVISGNLLTTLPKSIGDLRNLSKLDLFFNHLTVLPESMGNLRNLCKLNLSHNSLTLLPALIGNLRKLNKLNLSSNNLTELPAFIGNLRNLYALCVGNNFLTVLPGSLQKLPRLSDFSAYCNPLVKPDACKEIGVLLTSTNLDTLLFPSLKELAIQCIIDNNIPYNTTGHLTIPDDCFKCFKTYPVVLFTSQLGKLIHLKPIPITTDLSYEQIINRIQNGEAVIFRFS